MAFVTLSLCVISLFGGPTPREGEWAPLFNGKNYAGFTFWIPGGPEETFLVEDGCLAIKAAKAGFAYTRQKYRNYELVYEWRYERPAGLTDDATFAGNSGVFLHISIPLLKEWPRSIEVEGKYPDAGRLLVHEKRQGEIPFEATDDPAARQAAMRKVGAWNTTHVWCKDGVVKVSLNGKPVAEGKSEVRREGHIGFQAQGWAIYYRNIKIRELK